MQFINKNYNTGRPTGRR